MRRHAIQHAALFLALPAGMAGPFVVVAVVRWWT
jgi:hypothetical protein